MKKFTYISKLPDDSLWIIS